MVKKILDRGKIMSYNVKVSTLKDVIEEELGYTIEINMRQGEGVVRISIVELKQKVDITIANMIPYVLNDKALKEYVLKQVKQRILN